MFGTSSGLLKEQCVQQHTRW